MIIQKLTSQRLTCFRANLYSSERYMDLPVWTLNHPSVLLAVPEVFEDLPWFRAEIAPVFTIEHQGLNIINNSI